MIIRHDEDSSAGFGKSSNALTIYQPYILVREAPLVKNAQEHLVPVWLQRFDVEPTKEQLLDLILNSKPLPHQNVTDWQQLPKFTVGRDTHWCPNIIGLNEILTYPLPESGDTDIDLWVVKRGDSVCIGLWPRSRKAAEAFIANPQL